MLRDVDHCERLDYQGWDGAKKGGIDQVDGSHRVDKLEQTSQDISANP